jgi:ubiquinone biosynthesis protein
MKLDALNRLERHAKRLAEITGILGKYGLSNLFGDLKFPWIADKLRSSDGHALRSLTTPQRVRMALTELGTTFIKLGQMLSTRPDLLGPDLTDELAELQSNVPADSADIARATIEEDLGSNLESLFVSFEAEPLAAASIAQVHGATLTSGTRVVVKVLRAGVARQVETDLEIVQLLAELMERHSAVLRPYQPVAIVRQFRKSLLRELDFTVERTNLERFAEHFENDPFVHIPQVFPDLCSRRVLTMDRLDGIPGTDSAALQSSGEDLETFASRGASMYLDMVFRDGFYHADPHPGNLLLLPGGIVGVIDCGMVGRIDEHLLEDIEGLLFAVVERDATEVVTLLMKLGAASHEIDRDRFIGDISDFIADFVGRPLADIQIGEALSALFNIIRRFQVVLPPPLAMLLRTLILLEGTSRKFHPDLSLAQLMEPYYSRILRRRMSPVRIAKKARRMYRDWDRLLGRLPRDLRDLLERFSDGTLTVHLDHRHLDPIINRLVLGIIAAAIFLGSSQLWSSQAPPLLGGVSIFGALGYATSIYLTWRVLRAVKKSGNINSKD